MLVLVLPLLLVMILVAIIWSAFLIFRPLPFGSVEAKAEARQRNRPHATRRPRSRP